MWRRTLNRVVQTFLILLIAYYTLIGGFVVGVREYPWRIGTEILTFFMLGGWLLKKLINKEELIRTSLDWPILGLILASILSAVFSTDPRVSWENVLLNVLLALLFYFTLELTQCTSIRTKIINAILIIGLVIVGIGLLEFWEWYGGKLVSEVNWRSTGLDWRFENSIRVKSILQSSNYLAYYLLILVGLSLGKITDSRSWWLKIAWIGYMGVTLVVIALTQSRGGSLGVLVIFLSFFGLVWFNRLKLQTNKPARQTQYAALIALLVILASTIWIIGSRTTSLSALLAGDRLDFWLASLKMLKDHPLTGVGAGTFPAQYLLYRDLKAGAAFIITHAHNLGFTLIAEYGLLGLAAVLWVIVTFIKTVYRSFKQSTSKTEFIWLAAVAATLLGQATHNLFDDFLEFPVFTWYTIFLATLCLIPQPLSLGGRGESHQRRGEGFSAPVAFVRFMSISQKWPIRTLLAAATGLGLVIVALWFNWGFAAYHQAVQASNKEDWPQTATWLEQAVALDPAYRFYQQQLALSYGWLAYQDHRFLSKALAAQEKVVIQNTTYPLDYAHLACLNWEQGNTEAAIAAMSQAVRTEAALASYAGLKSWHTSRTTYQFNLGFYYEGVGNLTQAQEQYTQSILQRPEIAASIFWQQTPQRKQLFQKIMANIKRQGTSLEALYFAGNYQDLWDLSQAKLSEQPNDINARLMTAKALLAQGDQEKAAMVVNELIEGKRATYSPVYLDLIRNLSALPELEIAIQTAAVLGGQSTSPIIYYYWGQLAEAKNDLDQAKSKYQEAILRATAIDTDYANLVGRRLPLAQEKMPCLLLPFAKQELSAPSLRLAELYEAAAEQEAAKEVYENLLLYEPYNRAAQERLLTLCQHTPLTGCNKLLSTNP